MSYLRHPAYVWTDGTAVHLWPRRQDPDYTQYVQDCDFPTGIRLPIAVWDALGLMRTAQLEAEHDPASSLTYARALLRQSGGNVGAQALAHTLGPE